MIVSALFTILQWSALFPGLRDYLALAALPVRMRQVFVAKFTALLAVAGVVIAGAALPPSVIVPATMAGRYGGSIGRHVPGIFSAALLGGLFVFFTLVALQGLLLNLLPIRLFPRVSLAIQGFLLALLLAGLPIVFSIPDRPWPIYAPPLWFFGIDQLVFGNVEPSMTRLSRIAIAALLTSAAAAIATYLWSYRRHRIRILESPSVESAAVLAYWPDAWSDSLLPGERSLGVFTFIAKNLVRSRQHRLILTAFAGLSIAFISEGFASIALAGGRFRAISASTESVRESIIAIPLAISLFLLTGFRYLFRLPVELRANWLFRIVEPGHATELLAGVERFLLFWGALPVAALTLPIEVRLLGIRTGLTATIECLLISLLLIEFLLFTFERIPFTSSYLPGRRPLIETVLKYAVAAGCYIWGFAGLVSFSAKTGASTLIFTAILAAGWWRLRHARLASRKIGRLEFEEVSEPAVQLLGIERE
jgi:hypothetical protein